MDEHKLHDNAKAFVVKDGAHLHSLKDLYGHLNTITDAHFNHHVNAERNDFADWVEHALGDKFLAMAMRQTRTKDDMRKAVFISMFK